MRVINSAIFIILERFPDSKDAIKRLFRANSEFQTLCEDFRQCNQALVYWSQSNKTEAPARRKEYKELLGQLETEIYRFLNEMEHESPSVVSP